MSIEDAPVIEKKKTTNRIYKEPGKYKVLVFNDNVTTAEFVVIMLINIFHLSQDTAIKLMQEIHNDGSAVAGIYTFEIAEQKSKEATNMARQNGYPLAIKMEAE
jgi:ATP-dependent Clp protease adaptor protein ClpS